MPKETGGEDVNTVSAGMGRWLAAVQVKLNGHWLSTLRWLGSSVPPLKSAKVNRHRAPILISSFVGCVGSAGVSHQS